MNVKFHTFGCKVNQYETQLMRESLASAGYSSTTCDDDAQIFVINTCTVTGVSDRKARRLIRHLHRAYPNRPIIVTGCYAERDREALEAIEGVSLVLSNDAKSEVVSAISKLFDGEPPCSASAIRGISHFETQTRAMLKVQDGCDSFCSYCIIPFVRSRMLSRPIRDVLDELQRLAGNGYREVVITGIHLGAYGRDLENAVTLIDLLDRVRRVDGIERIRLSSLEPMDVSTDLIDLLASDRKFARHLHLSLQSGSDRIIRLMNRNYTSADFAEIVEYARRKIPNIGITTDVIVGFPGETDQDFKASYDFVAKMRFSRLHVFRFSPRSGTAAAKMPNKVDPATAKERSDLMINLGRKLQENFAARQIGREHEIILEQKEDNGMISGFTSNYVRTLIEANVSDMGDMVGVKIIGKDGEKLIGERISSGAKD